MNKISHIVPSGSNKTLCGLENLPELNKSSLGMCCNCEKCLSVAQMLINKKEMRK